ncbi:shikimate kinase [Noviherbaspirillum sp.]|uniref:shikimate kinase n=1 Tax=Noviherbaspirillum sp. TaxID=1926288 RepID=UPI002FE080E7
MTDADDFTGSLDIDEQRADPLSEKATVLTSRLGQRVRAARAARALSRKQLAVESGISLPYLSRVEKGDGNVSIGVLHRLALALNLPIENLLADTEGYGADYALIVELLKRQSHEKLGEIRRMLLDQVVDEEEAHAPRPRRIALIGLRGAGKSTLGPILAKRLSIPFVELNKEIEAEAGINLNEVFMIYRQAGYRRLERRCLERVISTYPEFVLATGGGIVTEPSTYELLLHSFYCVWLRADPEEHYRRVMAQHDVRIANEQLKQEAMENITRSLSARESLYALAAASVETTGKSIDASADEILKLMEEHRL